VALGTVIRGNHPTQGSIQVRINNGFQLDEMSDVGAVSPTNNNVLTWNAATSQWLDKSISTILGYTPANDSLVLNKASNLSDLQSASTARGNLGLDYATDAQVIAGNSTSNVVSPYGSKLSVLNLQLKDFSSRAFSYTGSGGGGSVNLNNSRDLFDINCPNNTSGTYAFISQPIEGLYNLAITSCRLDFSKPFEIRGRLTSGANPQTNSNSVFRFYLGGTSTVTLGDPTFKCVGIKFAGGGFVQLMVHNGTTLTTVNTNFTNTLGNNTWFDFILKSDGSGNCSLTINYNGGTSTVTTALGPTGQQNFGNFLYAIVENIGATTGQNRLYGTTIRGLFGA
jgi:hypothetical protein